MTESTDPSVLANLETVFAELFSAGANVRVVPLVVDRGYRGTAEEVRSVAYRRRVCCECQERTGAGQGFVLVTNNKETDNGAALRGCRKCEHVGWLVRGETCDVRLPAGVDIGKKLRLPGQGDILVSTAPGDLLVELAEEGERAAELREAQRAHEKKLDEQWTAARTRRVAERAQAKRRAIQLGAAVGVAFLVFGGVLVKTYLDKGELGAPCTMADDCRSSLCLTTRRAPRIGERLQDDERLVPGRSRLDPLAERGLCTIDCKADEDCPRQMMCEELRESSTLSPNIGHSRRGCGLAEDVSSRRRP
jgi:hypothetical protein